MSYTYTLSELAIQVGAATSEDAIELLAATSSGEQRLSAEELAKVALMSISGSNFERIEMLVDAGADVSALMPSGESLGLALLIEPKAPESLQAKIIEMINPSSIPSGPSGETLLMAAASLGRADFAGLLLRAGHNPNAKLAGESKELGARRGSTALMIATKTPGKGQDLIDLLIPVSDLSARDVSSNTALGWACDHGNAAAIQALMPGSDIRARDDQQKTMLIKAVTSGSLEAVRLILPRAKARARNDRRQSALMIAARAGSWPMVEELLPKSALAAVDEKGHTALMHAIVSPLAPKDEDVALKLLPMSPLTAGVGDIFTKKNLLMLAAEVGKARIVQELLAHFDPLAVDIFGETALMRAASGRRDLGFEALKVLLPLSNEEALSNDGYSATWFAERSSSPKCLALIKASALAKKEAHIFSEAAGEALAPSRKKPSL